MQLILLPSTKTEHKGQSMGKGSVGTLRFVPTFFLLTTATAVWSDSGVPANASDGQQTETTDTASSITDTSTRQPIIGQNNLSITEQLAALVKERRYFQAYQLSQQHSKVMEGDVAFDFYYGFSAAQSGFYNNAVFAFERLVDSYPEVPRYRLELARCYYHLNQLDDAEREFTRVSSQNPPPRVQSTIQSFLSRIREKRRSLDSQWRGSIAIAAGYDTNINKATNTSTTNIGEISVNLPKDYRAIDSSYYHLRGNISYRAPLNKRSSFDLGLDGSRQDNFKNNQYDLDQVHLNGGFNLNRSRYSLRIGSSARQFWLGRKHLMTQVAVNTRWHYRWNQTWQMNNQLELSTNDNKINNDLDGLQLWLSTGPVYNRNKYSAQTALLYSTNINNNSPLANRMAGISFNQRFFMNKTSSLYGLITCRQFAYSNNGRNNQSGFRTRKVRKEVQLALTAGYNHYILPSTLTHVQLSYTSHQSNEPSKVFQYDRTLLEAGVSLTF